MIRVSSCSRSYGFCHLLTGRLSNVGVPSLLIKRTFASHAPNIEKTQPALADREVQVQKSHMDDQISDNRSHKEIDLEKLSKKIMKKLKKNGHTLDSIGFTGSPPDGLDALLGWNKIKDERIKRDMIPERRKKIEDLAAKGDRLSQIQLEKILAYEKD